MFQKIVLAVLFFVLSFNSLADTKCQERTNFFVELILVADGYGYEIKTRDPAGKVDPLTIDEFTVIIFDEYHLKPFHINIRNGKGCNVIVMNSSEEKTEISKIVYKGFNDLVVLAQNNSGFDKVFFR